VPERVRKRDSILSHTLTRAATARAGGAEASSQLGKWDALAVTARATPKAVQVATFIITWATAWQLREDKSAAFGIEAYTREGFESYRTAYRRLADFRELWPEYDTPQPLAELIAAEVRRRKDDALPTVSFELELPVLA
jgi:hypothetical protein